ncbi:MAG: 3-deoxy-7-phosphoheptulonate synthase [Candidatus Glassbacteria bacterium]|nr:3-deoxy-7-phosphoheptulonate synthase [Candidatus Glassbacteria bacterium]
MIIVMKEGATRAQIDHVFEKVRELGYKTHPIFGEQRTVIGAIGDERGKFRLKSLESVPGVESVIPILKPYKLVGSELKRDKTVVKVGKNVEIGGKQFVIIAGPCSVESREQIIETAERVKKAGARLLRGGAFKPRTSPYSFQGLEEEGLELLAEARAKTGLPIVTEIMTPQDIPLVARFADVLQVGTRNMQNYSLLKQVGLLDKPVLLKRGLSATINEFLMSAEYIVSQGNPNVILCERGIRTFETATRNTLDLSAVPLIKQLSHLPVIVDPSHGTGIPALVGPMTKASAACGADGVMIEVHIDPENALSDGEQSLNPDQFDELVRSLKPILKAEGRKL